MSINLYGNVNGTYQPPNIDVFALAKAQNNKPVMFKDTEAGKNFAWNEAPGQYRH